MDYRQELKFICSQIDLEILRARLMPIMQCDKHQKNGNSYNIRSIYLDDYMDSFVWENESGINEREKYRLRIYNYSSKLIKAEIKQKKNSMTRKRVANLSMENCRRIIKGEAMDLMEIGSDAVLNQFAVYMHERLLRPAVIVEYDRSVFVYDGGNVRITFDQNIRCSKCFERFFEEDIFTIPVLLHGMHVLEVKYDEFLPDFIAQTLELGNLRQTSFSKYYLARKTMEEYGYDV